MRQISIPATYMRGGTSKGTFFCKDELPDVAQSAGEDRDKLLLRVVGSPDPYQKHTDGMGGATSSSSKVVIVSKSDRPDCDVDYLFGQVSIDQARIDWSGNCGNLTAAVGVFALEKGLVNASSIPDNGVMEVSIWQANIEKQLKVTVPVSDSQVDEIGDFYIDGVAFPSPELQVSFISPAPEDGSMFPTGNLIDTLVAPDIGELQATLIDVGIPTVFIRADAIGLIGTELQEDVNASPALLEKFEAIRTVGALAMGLISSPEEAISRQHTPKVAFVSEPVSYTASSGKQVDAVEIDVLVRALSMGKLHHAMMGTASVAIGVAGCVPGTLVNQAAGGSERDSIVFGHPSGTMKVGAEIEREGQNWVAKQASMSRSARVLMEGRVRIPS